MGTYTPNISLYIPDYKQRDWAGTGTLVSNNFTILDTEIAANATHKTSDGTDHSYIDQDVTTTASPSFSELDIGLSGYSRATGLVGMSISQNTNTVGIELSSDGAKELYFLESNGSIQGYLSCTSSGDLEFVNWSATGAVNFLVGAGGETDSLTIQPDGDCDFAHDIKVTSLADLRGTLDIGQSNPVSSIEATLSSSTTSLPLSSAVKAYVDNISDQDVSTDATPAFRNLKLERSDAAHSPELSVYACTSSRWDCGLTAGYRSRGTLTTPTAVEDLDWVYGDWHYGYDGSSWSPCAAIYSQVDGAVSSGVVPGSIVIATASSSGVMQYWTIFESDKTLAVNGQINLKPVTAPATPLAGFVLYTDSADGNLKCKSSGGTVTTLATA